MNRKFVFALLYLFQYDLSTLQLVLPTSSSISILLHRVRVHLDKLVLFHKLLNSTHFTHSYRLFQPF